MGPFVGRERTASLFSEMGMDASVVASLQTIWQQADDNRVPGRRGETHRDSAVLCGAEEDGRHTARARVDVSGNGDIRADERVCGFDSAKGKRARGGRDSGEASASEQ